jgi:hypothetical protein
MICRKSIATAIFVTLAVPFISTGATAQNTTPSTTPASGDTQWQKDHPRREQVNQRLKNQNARINQEVKEGEMSKTQAAKLHKNDRQIRKEERMMASQNGGHITKAEQKALNQQENRNSKKIGK